MASGSSKLLCAVIWGAVLWCCVVIPFASLRLNFDIRFTKDVLTETAASDGGVDTQLVSREVFDNLDLPGKYAHQIFGPPAKSSKSLDSMCTMVMLTYKREKLLPFLLNHYCMVRSLHRIIVVWNNVNASIPDEILNIRRECTTDLVFIREKVNRLTNRFKPRPEIETNCVCIIDDDRFIVDLRDLEFAFDMWQEFKHRIVGFEHRTHSDVGNGSLWYDLTDFRIPRTNYSMMLTATAVLHKAYLEMFYDQRILPKGMINYIDERRNCEDIGINVMVAKFLQDLGYRQAACLAVKPKHDVKNLESSNEGEYKGLSSLSDHFKERSKCLNDFKVMYGGALPLVHSTFIVEEMRKVSRIVRPRHNASRYNRTHLVRSKTSSHSHNTTVDHKSLIQQKQRALERSAGRFNATHHGSLNSTTINRSGSPYSRQPRQSQSSPQRPLSSSNGVNTHNAIHVNNHPLVNGTSSQRVAHSPGRSMKRENIDHNLL